MSQSRDYPTDAAEIARLVRKADEVTAVLLVREWGAKQRAIGGRNAVVEMQEAFNAQA